ncbi:MAG: hypothetical protein KC964_04040 [Candidatus Omnitrophica bacterium]|nr:hypothetical protein [Candidatus Omnitrophota bacterium]
MDSPLPPVLVGDTVKFSNRLVVLSDFGSGLPSDEAGHFFFSWDKGFTKSLSLGIKWSDVVTETLDIIWVGQNQLSRLDDATSDKKWDVKESSSILETDDFHFNLIGQLEMTI